MIVPGMILEIAVLLRDGMAAGAGNKTELKSHVVRIGLAVVGSRL